MERSRTRRRSKWKWYIPLAVLILILLIAAVYMYVQYINADERVKEADIIRRANESVKLTEISDVEKSVWDDVIYVVEGKDEQGQERLVWVFPNKVVSMYAFEGIKKEAMKAKIKAQYNKVHIVRLLPGFKDGQYIWQAMLERADEQGNNRYYYHFYLFADGSPFGEIYGLPNK
ncbi:cell wall elongation regulator TseB-like domain-containing protein [Paenibacillus apiarius]|uniref:DUF5590 domain-containing protein n=1 Tax=Paenibacillus apiarius TaxID=46240 RepID=A0ABT4DVE3_9BACL|nr:DUF5590 domain-containing protein [Paenibacillus apiarius]MCY9515815.1 DUF5590 domain-containing protein [Paenibacillus apiarius]MCY9520725.1 DUF5590 domain-containing protein [Paenibacillus apiarius]MCY9553429.1 DUF5590 domain-containing protein [Paenibacillus apiarius]MCY9558047.1 DUF5590 domain-containing protein [Paenibacillus apiarius]MCY9685902.1 DUF5590 domain-containing protein [Paenibacillus apiarius]